MQTTQLSSITSSENFTGISAGSIEVETASSSILSSTPLADWRGSLTSFQGFRGTTPDQELIGVTWQETSAFMCPHKPLLVPDKMRGKYVVPCQLKEAPLVGKTLEAAKANGRATVGKMRSKGHMTEASFLIMDIDGVPEAEFLSCLDRMRNDGTTYLAYTTHSFGNPEKPGMRARVIIPIDRAISVDEYEAAWHGFDHHYFEGKAGKADSSGSKMCQQQGTWSTNMVWSDKAKSWRNEGGVVSSDFLINLGREVLPEKPMVANLREASKSSGEIAYQTADANKIADACRQIRAFRDTKGAGQSEPLWFDCVGVVAYCQDGALLCQVWSSGHTSYDEQETANKVIHRIKTPPTTCDQFRKTNPDGCNGCPHSYHSPIALGYRQLEPLEAIQKQFGLLNMDGKVWVFDREALGRLTDQGLAPRLSPSNQSDAKLLIRRKLAAEFPNIQTDQVIDDFFISPRTTLYTGVEFNPLGSSGDALNLWVGPTIMPRQGSWEIIRACRKSHNLMF